MVNMLEGKSSTLVSYINYLLSFDKIRKGSYGTLMGKAVNGRIGTLNKLMKGLILYENDGAVSSKTWRNPCEALIDTINRGYDLNKGPRTKKLASWNYIKRLADSHEEKDSIIESIKNNIQSIEKYQKDTKKLTDEIDNSTLFFQETESALNGSVKTYTSIKKYFKANKDLTFFDKYKSSLVDKIKSIFRENGSIKFKISTSILMYKVRKDENFSVTFSSKMYTLINSSYAKDRLELCIKNIIEILEAYNQRGSDVVISEINDVSISFVKYDPLLGSSYIELPNWIKDKRACVNVKNSDEKCFLWAIASALKPVEKNAFRVSNYDITQFKTEGLEFPMKVDNIKKFERMNDINVNVLTFNEQKNFCRIHGDERNQYTRNVNLLLFNSEEEDTYHYVWVKHLSRFLASRDNYETHSCIRCFTQFKRKEKLDSHMKYCQITDEAQAVKMPEIGEKVSFTNWKNMLKIPFVIYADFESILPKIEDKETNDYESYTTKTHEHIVSGFCFKTVCIHDQFNKTVLYRGENAIKKFVYKIKEEYDRIISLYRHDVGIKLTPVQQKEYDNAKECYVCRGKFGSSDNLRKVRDHDHLDGSFRGAAHQDCNKKLRYPSYIPVIFHNLKGYDSHFIINNVKDEFKNIKCIANNSEKYITFSLDKLKFIDSFQFMTSSLEALVNNLKKDINSFKHMSEAFKDNTEFMLGKGVYCYEYVDDLKKFDETVKPKIEDFYSTLRGEQISKEDYKRFCDVWKKMKIKNLGEYHDLYLKTDVLQLADVFENFRKTCLEYYELDPCHYITVPGLAWDAMLKITKIELELLNDIDMHLFYELGIRGGVSVITHRYAKANNQYIDEYDEKEKKQFLIDLDANNLYGWAMCKSLPYRGFKWVEDVSIFTSEYINNIADNSVKGYTLEVDVDYPEELHDLHNDYPFLPENINVNSEDVSPWSKNLINVLELKPTKVKKLVPNLNDKKNYVIDYRALKQALKNGLKLNKVHRVVEYEQKDWLKEYIMFNTAKRTVAKNDFEKDFFKLMNNSVFGKTMENVRNRIKFELVMDEKSLMKFTKKPLFKDSVIFNEDLVGIYMRHTYVTLDKPIYVGQAILDLSKTLMYDFHYDFIKEKYGNKATLLGTDTDSLKYAIETDDLYEDMRKNSDLFDFSEYPADHKCFDTKNKKVIGKFKDELGSKVMETFIGLRSKMYVQQCEDKTKKVAKGISKTTKEKNVTIEDYEMALFGEKNIYKKMVSLRSYKHRMYTIELNKSGLCAYDDKRWIMNDGVSTLAHGHYRINEMKEDYEEQSINEDIPIDLVHSWWLNFDKNNCKINSEIAPHIKELNKLEEYNMQDTKPSKEEKIHPNLAKAWWDNYHKELNKDLC